MLEADSTWGNRVYQETIQKSSEDGHWLKLEKSNVVPTFSSFNVMPGKLTKKIIAMVCDPWWNGFDIFNPQSSILCMG